MRDFSRVRRREQGRVSVVMNVREVVEMGCELSLSLA